MTEYVGTQDKYDDQGKRRNNSNKEVWLIRKRY